MQFGVSLQKVQHVTPGEDSLNPPVRNNGQLVDVSRPIVCKASWAGVSGATVLSFSSGRITPCTLVCGPSSRATCFTSLGVMKPTIWSPRITTWPRSPPCSRCSWTKSCRLKWLSSGGQFRSKMSETRMPRVQSPTPLGHNWREPHQARTSQQKPATGHRSSRALRRTERVQGG